MNRDETASYIEALRRVQARFADMANFTATATVSSMTIPSWPRDRVLCVPGDRVEVVRWFCTDGPTIVKVTIGEGNERVGNSHGRPDNCIPWGWVVKMGAPPELGMHMPFPDAASWDEVIARVRQGAA